ncbi:MAG: chemotaxis protein CheW [Pseudomonadota bacterium]
MSALVEVERPPAAAAGQPQQYLTFVLAGEMLAMPIAPIKEIIEYGQVTRVPMMPEFIRGVINLRGAVVPVVDLASRFGGQPGQVGRRTCIVIVELRVEGEPLVLGVVVDAVNAVLEIGPESIEPPPAFGTRIRTDFIHGMGKVGGKFVVILDVERVLSVEELSVVGHAQASAEGAGRAAA